MNPDCVQTTEVPPCLATGSSWLVVLMPLHCCGEFQCLTFPCLLLFQYTVRGSKLIDANQLLKSTFPHIGNTHDITNSHQTFVSHSTIHITILHSPPYVCMYVCIRAVYIIRTQHQWSSFKKKKKKNPKTLFYIKCCARTDTHTDQLSTNHEREGAACWMIRSRICIQGVCWMIRNRICVRPAVGL